jgi:putative transposase
VVKALAFQGGEERLGERVVPALAGAAARQADREIVGKGGVVAAGVLPTSFAFGRRLAASKLVASMGTVGDALDNAVAESFFATLECELLDRYPWPTRAGLRTAIFDFIEVFYNRQRRHSTLDYHPPAAYEQHHASAASAANTVSTETGQLQHDLGTCWIA